MIFLFLLLVLLVPLLESKLVYIALCFFAVYGLFRYLFKGFKGRGLNFSAVQWCVFLLPILIFFSWIYGVVLGLINGVSIEYVISNFAGLAIYILFYMFFLMVDIKTACRALFSAAIVATVFAFYIVVTNFYSVEMAATGDGIGSYRSLYSGVFLYVAPFIFAYLMFLSSKEVVAVPVSWFDVTEGFSGLLLFLAFSFTLLIPAMSKGFILVYVVAMTLYFAVGFMYALVEMRSNKIFLCSALFLLFSVFLILLTTDLFNIIIFTFSNVEESNLIRSEQLSRLLDEWSFMGSGLGSSLASGYSRDDTGYGFELTYVNLVNKLGVFSFPLFISYMIPVFFGIKWVFTEGKRVIGGWILGLMAYLIPGAGNPILLAPEFVVLHFIALATVIRSEADGSKNVLTD